MWKLLALPFFTMISLSSFADQQQETETNKVTGIQSWNVKGLPTNFVLDPKGDIIYRAIGGREFDHSEIQNKILDLNG